MICFPLDNTEYTAAGLGSWMATRTRGVFSADSNLAVSIGSGMSVSVSPGLAWLKMSDFWGVSVLLEQAQTLTLTVGDGFLPRIDAIVLRLNKTDNKAELAVRQGFPASTPTVASPTRNTSYDEIYLATVSVGIGTSALTVADITDQRLNEDYCGLMRDGVTGIPTSQLQDQVEALLTDLQDALSSALSGAIPDGSVTTAKFSSDAKTPYAGSADTAGTAGNGVRTLTHVKSGVNHALTGLGGASGILSCQFKATAAFAAGNTLKVDGTSYTIKLTNGEDAEDNLFVSGAIVSCIVDTSGKTVNFKAAGGQKLPAGTTAIVKTFTANGTFTVPQTGKYRVTVFGKGGNGSDSYANSSNMIDNGTGGGAGGIAVSNLTLTKDDTYPVTVTSSTSSFGSLLSAAAGKNADGTTAGTGGTASGGNLLAESGENGTAGPQADPWNGGTGGGYSGNAVSISPFASDTGGEGGSPSRVSSSDSSKSGQTQKLTGYGLPAFGTGGGGGGYYVAYSSYTSQAGAEGMPGAVIVELAFE